MLRILAFVCIFSMAYGSGCSASPYSNKQYNAVMDSLDWQMEGTYPLSDSHSTLVLPHGYLLALGQDADKLCRLDGNSPHDYLEAAILTRSGDTIYFSSQKDGYVSLADWENIDSEKMLAEIWESTQKCNETRRQNGFIELREVKWLQEPKLDMETKTVFWVTIGTDYDDYSSVNAVALRLGREGYEELRWLTDRESYNLAKNELDHMLRAHSFDDDYRYVDYADGDPVADYGIAALVALAAGAKAIKAGGLTGMLLALKKGISLVGTGLAAIAYGIRKKFRGQKGM